VKALRRIAAIALLALTAGLIAFWWGFRTKDERVLGAVRSMNRRVMNPAQMQSAGQPGSYASVIRHQGRNSGVQYETPIVALEDGTDFVIALPYGTKTDWLANVLAAGHATIIHQGESVPVESPQVRDIADYEHLFRRADQRMHGLFGVEQCVVLHEKPTIDLAQYDD